MERTNQKNFTFQNVNTSKCKIRNVRVQQHNQCSAKARKICFWHLRNALKIGKCNVWFWENCTKMKYAYMKLGRGGVLGKMNLAAKCLWFLKHLFIWKLHFFWIFFYPLTLFLTRTRINHCVYFKWLVD